MLLDLIEDKELKKSLEEMLKKENITFEEAIIRIMIREEMEEQEGLNHEDGYIGEGDIDEIEIKMKPYWKKGKLRYK